MLWGRLPMAKSTLAFSSIMRLSGALALMYEGGAQPVNLLGPELTQ